MVGKKIRKVTLKSTGDGDGYTGGSWGVSESYGDGWQKRLPNTLIIIIFVRVCFDSLDWLIVWRIIHM